MSETARLLDGNDDAPSTTSSVGRTLGSQASDDKQDFPSYIDAYEAVQEIYLLLYHNVRVGIIPNQVRSSEAHIGVIQALKRHVRRLLGQYSGTIIYACLYVRGINIELAKLKPNQADILMSRANIAELLAIQCVSELQVKGKALLALAFCSRYVPFVGLVPPTPQFQPSRNGNSSSSDRLGPPKATPLTNSDQASPHPRPTRTFRALHREMLKKSSSEYILEVAARTEAKLFTVQPSVWQIVQFLWVGRIRWKDYDPQLSLDEEESNRQNGTQQQQQQQQPSTSPLSAQPVRPLAVPSRGRNEEEGGMGETAGSEPGVPPMLSHTRTYLPDPDSIQYMMPAGAHFTTLEVWLAKTLSPLRIPAFQNNVCVAHLAVFVVLYFAVLYFRSPTLTSCEAVFIVVGLAMIVDELRQLHDSGLILYTKNLWNSIDLLIYSIFITYLGFRTYSLCLDNSRDPVGTAAAVDRAYDVLSLNGIVLWPRLFAVLDQYEFFGTLVIQLKYMLQATGLFVIVLVVFLLGFFQTFWLLSKRYAPAEYNEMSEIGGLMLRIFFGNNYIGFETAENFGPLSGRIIMLLYISISVLVLYNILIGVINQAYARILDNAQQEFRFAMMLRVLEYVTAHTTYPFIPPFNLVQYSMLTPLRHNIPLRTFVLVRSIVLVLLYSPHLVVYSAIRRISSCYAPAKDGFQGHENSLLGTAGDVDLARHEVEYDGESTVSSSGAESSDYDGYNDQGYETTLTPSTRAVSQMDLELDQQRQQQQQQQQPQTQMQPRMHTRRGGKQRIPIVTESYHQPAPRLVAGPNHRLVAAPSTWLMRHENEGAQHKNDEYLETWSPLRYSEVVKLKGKKRMPAQEKEQQQQQQQPRPSPQSPLLLRKSVGSSTTVNSDKSCEDYVDASDAVYTGNDAAALNVIRDQLSTLESQQQQLATEYRELNCKLDTLISFIISGTAGNNGGDTQQ